MLEEDGEVDEAAEILQEVQVETCGAMERREKAEYILEQMRLVLGKKDFVRLQIISRKINPKLLNADDFQDIKLKYYEYNVKLHLDDTKFLDIAKAYYNEAIDLLHKVKATESKYIEKIPWLYELLNSFLTVELIGWPLPCEVQLRAHAVFNDNPHPG